MNKTRLPSCLLTLLSLASAGSAQDLASGARGYSLGNQPGNPTSAIIPGEHAIADLDGDGDLDIVNACASTGGPKFSLLFNAGDGTFGVPVFRNLNGAAPSVVAADVHGDGAVDLAFARWQPGSGNQVYVFRNDGTGGFPTFISVTVGSKPRDIGAADLDLDGDTDLVTINESGSFSLLRNSGSGTFTVTTTSLAGGLDGQPYVMELGDLNGDGRADLAYSEVFGSGVKVLFNTGTTFGGAPLVLPVTGGQGAPLAIGDTDGDGDRDLVYARGFEIGKAFAVDLFANLGGGSFAPGVRVAIASELLANDVAIGDVDGNGIADIVVAGNLFDLGSTSVTPGLGGGAFGPPADYPSGRGPAFVGVADLDGDGRDEVTCTNTHSQSLKVFHPGADGMIALPEADWLNSQFGFDPVAGDLDLDGDVDVVLAESSQVSTLLNDGSGQFTRLDTPMQFLGCTEDTHLADLDGDGLLDLLATRDDECPPYRLLTMHGRGDGSFDPLVTWSFAPAPGGDTAGGNRSIATLDWDHDGDLDVAVTETSGCPSCPTYRMFLFDGNGAGGFTGLREWSGGAQAYLPTRLVAGDFDADGHDDLLSTLSLGFLRGHGDGEFDPVALYEPSGGATWLATGDLDLDGDLDAGYVSINMTGGLGPGGVTGAMLNDGGAHFTQGGKQWGPFDLEYIPEHGVAMGDVNGDGLPDVVAASTEACDVLVFAGDGTGALAPARRYGTAGRTYRPSIADFTGDGLLDVGVAVAATMPIADSYYSVLPGVAAAGWTNLGFGLAGAGGVPLLAGTGALEAGATITLSLGNAAPAAPVLLFVSFASTPVPFKGGTLAAFPAALLLSLATDGAGTLDLSAAWPAGVPSGTAIFFQCVVQDPGGPQGASLSNAITEVVP